ncbi:hypothetical protein D918_04009 [Trichuris suis]|nr:hypothetical protein D918_04009 [Trichuris suis]
MSTVAEKVVGNEHLAKMEKALDKFKKSDLRSPVVREKIEALRAAADRFRVRLDKKAVAGDSESVRYKRMQALLYRTRDTLDGRPAAACSAMFEESAIPVERPAGVTQTAVLIRVADDCI